MKACASFHRRTPNAWRAQPERPHATDPAASRSRRVCRVASDTVARDELDAATRELALQIAQKHPFALRMAKRAVNQTLDIQGFIAALQAVFDIHQLGHGYAISGTAWPVLMGPDGMKGEVART
jgi:hypothetical protein